MRTCACRVGYLDSVSACTRFVEVRGMALAVLAIDWSCLVARRALPNNRFDVVPSALPPNSGVRGAIFANSVETGGATHATSWCPRNRGVRWIVGSRAYVRNRERVGRALLLKCDDSIDYSVAHPRRIVLKFLELLPCWVRVAVLPVTLHLSECD